MDNYDHFNEILEIRERQGYRSYDCKHTGFLEHISMKTEKCLTQKPDCHVYDLIAVIQNNYQLFKGKEKTTCLSS
jgi:hypothetical protein